MSVDSQKLLELAERAEKAEGPDGYLDVEIKFAIAGQRNVGGGWAETIATGERVRVDYLAPFYTASLDAALTLVPQGWYWRCGRTTSYQAWAVVNRTHPDHCEPNQDEFFAHREHWKTEKWTPVLALCAAALHARAAALGQD